MGSRTRACIATFCVLHSWLIIRFLFLQCFEIELSRYSKTAASNESIGQLSTLICAIVKDELRYLDEWVDYHFAIGFSMIIFYDNSDDTQQMRNWRKGRLDRNKLAIFDAIGEKQQMIAYKDCASKATSLNHSWILFADVDEFLVLKKHKSVDSFITEQGASGQIFIKWRIFGTSGHLRYTPDPVLYRFQCRVPDDHPQNVFTKSLIDLAELDLSQTFSNPHSFPMKRMRAMTRTLRRKAISSLPRCDTQIAVINHYYYRSHEEYIEKRKRGDVFHGGNGTFLLNESKLGIDVFTGQPIPGGTLHDNIAWITLVEKIPKYKTSKHIDFDSNACTRFQGENFTSMKNFPGFMALVHAFKRDQLKKFQQEM
jgi:Glycosyl transferase family 2